MTINHFWCAVPYISTFDKDIILKELFLLTFNENLLHQILRLDMGGHGLQILEFSL